MGERRVIGILVGGIMDDGSMKTFLGAKKKAKELDVDVVLFPGKYIYRNLTDHHELIYEYQYNTIFEYPHYVGVDALVISIGALGCFATKKQKMNFLKRFQEIPHVIISDKFPGEIDISTDNETGLRDGLLYLLEQGCQVFGMIGGSDANADAFERKQVFFRTLRENQIPEEDIRYTEGDLSRYSTGIFNDFLEKNPDLEAVFCVNDEVAIGLYDAIKKRGLQPGRDISVLGYDDSALSVMSTPSLSSVSNDLQGMGARALEMACSLLKGEQVESCLFPTHFILRDSFVSKGKRKGKHEDNILKDIDLLFRRVQAWEENADDLEAKRKFELFIKTLLKGKTDSDEAIGYLQEFIDLNGIWLLDVSSLVDYLFTIMKNTVRLQEMTEETDAFKSFEEIYARLMLALNGELGRVIEEQSQTNYDMKIFVQNTLQLTTGRDSEYALLLQNLAWLDIYDAGVFIYQEPYANFFSGTFEPSGELYLKALMKRGEISLPTPDSQRVKLSEMISLVRASDSRNDLVFLPLFFQEMIYGVIVCNMSAKLFTNGDFLVNEWSMAARILNLLQYHLELQKNLEDNISKLSEKNITLENQSNRDELTGIYNRRGFYFQAGRMIDELKDKEERLMIGYVDMNNLKLINDLYGHKEGDFSLALIGRMLGTYAGADGIAGRIGGDEFAVAVRMTNKKADTSDRMRALYESFEEFNRTSDKDYVVTVSAG
ncbi:MAG: GGDEF domain-containing protein, partial [Lachnospiraceae bacterium]|nr:GGDEF domain-containing protein [Lachnospiraceae bacterium]